MAVYDIVESRKAVQYTGSNSAEIDAAITDLTIVSETGGVLTVTSNSNQFAVNTNDWVLFWQGYVLGVFDSSSYNLFYVANAVLGDVEEIQDALNTLGGVAVRSVGVATAPTLLLNTPVNVAVQLVPAMPDTSYTAQAYMFGSGVLGNVAINSTTITDNDTVTVNIQTSLVSLVGTHILVVVRD